MAKKLKYSLSKWPNTQFSYWSEFGDDYEDFPSAQSCVDPERVAQYDLPKLLNYLKSGYILAASPRLLFPMPFTDKLFTGGLYIMTDGKWTYEKQLPQYIKKHKMAIPDEWYEHIKANNFEVPKMAQAELERLFYPKEE